jgi:hypothetical protein
MLRGGDISRNGTLPTTLLRTQATATGTGWVARAPFFAGLHFLWLYSADLPRLRARTYDRTPLLLRYRLRTTTRLLPHLLMRWLPD